MFSVAYGDALSTSLLGLRFERNVMDPKVFDPADVAREKADSRAEDARAIAAHEKSPEQVRRDNACFAFPNVRLRYPARER